MEVANSKRMLVALLTEICTAAGIEIKFLSDDWIVVLQSGNKRSYIFGYNFEVNSATAQLIAEDKSATAQVLTLNGIPSVEHALFHGPQMAAYIPSNGNWMHISEYFHLHNNDVVCKPNSGTGGHNVIHVQNPIELEAAVYQLLKSSRSFCMSPFFRIQAEYRIYMFRNHCHMAYEKIRPSITGDGKSTFLELLLHEHKSGELQLDTLRNLQSFVFDEPLPTIPAAGKQILINWRHNLGLGSQPRLIDEDDDRYEALTNLASRAMAALQIALAAVDIIEINGSYLVLEINSGVMMESFAKSSTEHRERAKHFYHQIVHALMEQGGSQQS